MRRREFITLLGGAAAAWPIAARGQSSIPVLGFINGSSATAYAAYVQAFIRGLAETGYTVGENVAIEYRWAEGHYDRVPDMVDDLVRRRVAVLAPNTPAAHAPVIGLLSSRSAATDTQSIAVFRQALNEGGFVEGQNVVIDYRWADGQYDRLPALATSLVRRQVDIIVTFGGEVSGLAAKAATATIPIVFASGTDPVAIGLVTNLHRPGGNITGISGLLSEQMAKRLGLLQELVPKAPLIGVLVNPSYSGFDLQLQQVQEAAGTLR